MTGEPTYAAKVRTHPQHLWVSKAQSPAAGGKDCECCTHRQCVGPSVSRRYLGCDGVRPAGQLTWRMLPPCTQYPAMNDATHRTPAINPDYRVHETAIAVTGPAVRTDSPSNKMAHDTPWSRSRTCRCIQYDCCLFKLSRTFRCNRLGCSPLSWRVVYVCAVLLGK